MSTGSYRKADATVSAYDARAVTPNDATDINCSRALYIGTGGDIQVTMVLGTVITFEDVPSGTVFPVQVTRVWAAGTTATGIVALY